MRQLAGVVYFDGRPVSSRDEAEALGGDTDPESDSVEFHRAPGLLLADVESITRRSGRRIAIWPSGDACAWEGRLDNRAELTSRLGGARWRAAAECELALAVYRADGIAGWGTLIGDWSLVVWDAANRKLLLASDYAGSRPLYYHTGGGRVLWSSSLAHLLRWLSAREIDEDYVARFLSRGTAGDRTPYRGIYAVPPASAICVSQRGLSASRFWNLPIEAQSPFHRPEEYEDRLRDLFREAVAARINTDSPVCAELSGGLDSSSVVSMATRLISDHSSPAPGLVTFTYCEEANSDEPFYRCVERAYGLESVHLNANGAGCSLLAPGTVGRSAPMWWEPRFTEVAQRMGALGSDVLLTGQLGDLVMANWRDDSEQVSDYLRRGQLTGALTEAFAWSRSLQVPVYPILWRALKANFSHRPAVGNSDFAATDSARLVYGDSITPALRRRVCLDERRRLRAAEWRRVSPARRKRLWALSELLEGRRLQCPEPLQHLSYTHPFAHRPLVEFMMTIPPGLTCRPGEPRWLMRRSLSGIVPPAVLRRRSKGVYNRLFTGCFVPLAGELLRNSSKMRLVEAGYVDRPSVETRLQRLIQGLDCNESQLWNLILLESWLQSRDLNAGPATATGPAAELAVR